MSVIPKGIKKVIKDTKKKKSTPKATPTPSAALFTPAAEQTAPSFSPISSGLSSYYKATPYTLTPEQEAQQTINQEFAPKRSALSAALEANKRAVAQGVSAHQGFGQKQDVNLQQIYDELTSKLQSNQGATQQEYGNSKQKLQDIFSQVAEKQQATKSGVEESLREQAQRLGVQAALDNPVANLQNTLAELQGYSQAGNQGQQAALSGTESNQLAYGQRGIQQSQQEKASERSNLSDFVTRAVTELQGQGAESQMDIGRQLADLGGQEGSALATLINKITSGRAQQEQDNEGDAFARMIQEQTLALQGQRLGLDTTKAQQDYGIDLARLAQDPANDPLAQAKTQADIDRINSQTALNKSKTGTGSSNQGSGQPALNNFLNTPQSGYWAGAAGPKFRSAMQQIISSASEAKTIGIDPYSYALTESSKYPGLNRDALYAAIGIFFDRVS